MGGSRHEAVLDTPLPVITEPDRERHQRQPHHRATVARHGRGEGGRGGGDASGQRRQLFKHDPPIDVCPRGLGGPGYHVHDCANDGQRHRRPRRRANPRRRRGRTGATLVMRPRTNGCVGRSSGLQYLPRALIARCVATFSAPTDVPLALAASLSDILRSFSSSIAVRCPLGSAPMARSNAWGSR